MQCTSINVFNFKSGNTLLMEKTYHRARQTRRPYIKGNFSFTGKAVGNTKTIFQLIPKHSQKQKYLIMVGTYNVFIQEY